MNTPPRRKVAVVTTSRADYSHLRGPLTRLRAHSAIDLRVVAIGPQLAPEFGCAVNEITADGFVVDERVECLLSSDTDVGMAKSIGVATLGLAEVLGRMRPDLLFLAADRYELLAPASVALALRIPIVHLEGGEVSEGAIDDAVRNAITRMAHVHMTTTEAARRRVLAMGEEPWRVHRVGAPSLDHLVDPDLPARSAIEERLGVPLRPPTILVAYHPVTLARDTLREVEALFAALEALNRQVVFCFPNADAGSRALAERARAFCARRQDCRLLVNLRPVDYLALLRDAALLLGNSSSGIMETATLGVPTVDVGIRQRGRERARNVLHAEADRDAILASVARALDPSFRASLAGLENPYGDGRASDRIVRILTEVPLGEALLHKRALLPKDGGPTWIAPENA